MFIPVYSKVGSMKTNCLIYALEFALYKKKIRNIIPKQIILMSMGVISLLRIFMAFMVTLLFKMSLALKSVGFSKFG